MSEIATVGQPFTLAQSQELTRLMAEYQLAQANTARFINYLRREYNAPAEEGYDTITVEHGFTKSKDASSNDGFVGAGGKELLNQTVDKSLNLTYNEGNTLSLVIPCPYRMLRIYLLGRLDATLDDQVIQGFRSIKTQAILGYLAIRQASIRRSELIALFWPNFVRQAGLSSLRSSLMNLHALLGDHISISRNDVQLVNYWCDANAVGTRTTNLVLMPGCEGIASPKFQAWLRNLKAPPHHEKKETSSQDDNLDLVKSALITLSGLGWNEEATRAMIGLGTWLLDAGHATEAEQFTQYAKFMSNTIKKQRFYSDCPY